MQESQLLQNEDLQTFFNKLIQRVHGLKGILVTDRDGINIFQVLAPSVTDLSQDSSMAATFAIASEQASKLKLGTNKTITSFYSNRVILHLNLSPLIVSFVGDEDINLGSLQAFLSDTETALSNLKNSIKETEEM